MDLQPIQSRISSEQQVDSLLRQLELWISQLGPTEASKLLKLEPVEMVVRLLQEINPHAAEDILDHFPWGRCLRLQPG